MSQHHKSLHRAYKIITTLEPLGPAASPGTKTRFRETAKLCRLYAGQMLTHISGVCEASEISSDEDEITMDIKQPNIIKETAASRYADIRALVAEGDCLTTPYLLTHIFGGSGKVTVQKAEDQAFVRLLLGYKIIETVDEIVSVLLYSLAQCLQCWTVDCYSATKSGTSSNEHNSTDTQSRTINGYYCTVARTRAYFRVDQ